MTPVSLYRLPQHSQIYTMLPKLDKFLGGLFSTILVIGGFTNCLSIHYFWTTNTHNRNSLFFKRLYVLISWVDSTICLTLLPIIDAAVSSERQGSLFGMRWFCEVWGVLWSYLPIVSVFLIAVLSISRLLLLIMPTLRFKPGSVWWIFGGYSAGLLTLIISLYFTKIVNFVYRPEWMSCSASVFHPDINTSDLVRPGDIERGVLITALFSTFPGLSIVPISAAGILSLVYLRRSAAVAGNALNASGRQQRSATVSVITVTLLYVVLNLPFFFTVLSGIFMNVMLMRKTEKEITFTVQDYNIAKVSDNPLFTNYTYLIIFYLLISLNSFLNPFMYYWRMNGYRKYVKKLIKRNQRKVRREVMGLQMQNSRPAKAKGTSSSSLSSGSNSENRSNSGIVSGKILKTIDE